MKYAVGDVVTIRSWEAMEREFGVYYDGYIKNYFTKHMRSLCGGSFIVKEIADGKCYFLEDCKKPVWNWHITDDMIAHNFKYGEEIDVSDDGDHWTKRIFVGYIDGHSHPFACVEGRLESKFLNREKFQTQEWCYARKVQKPEIEITVRINGKEAKLSDISEETLKKIRGIK